MSGLKTFIAGAVLTLAASASSASVNALDPLIRDLAVCVGRYSATIEHAYMYGTPLTEGKLDKRQQLSDMIEAVIIEDEGPIALSMQINAKVAQRQLLTRAQLDETEAGSDWAQLRAEEFLRQCEDQFFF